ncbi:MAG TPA: DUF4390 domain-containing protein [Gammaproteobacteria bacterium]|jgi:hypothetical protein|nr:DUF4390 domain-containing protein [Gammaproteobacteria bacterium]
MTRPDLRRCFAGLGLGAVLALGLAGAAHADAGEEPGFVIRTAYTELVNGVYYLNADVGLNLSDDAVNALENGLPLTVELQIEVIKHRTWWTNQQTAYLEQRYQISYHELSRRFIVTNLNSGEQQSYLTYREAITDLGQVSDLPVIDANLLDPEARYNIRIRAVLDVKSFPGPLQLIASLFKGWDLSSDWYQWVLVSP